MVTNIQQWWQEAAPRTRYSFIGGAAFIIILMVLALYWLFRSDYQVLFTDLNTQDAAALVKELDKLKTPYELASGGTSILVPSDVVYKTRLKLMGQNIPLQGGVGFEIFNNSDFGMTEFAQKVNYQRALQGELTRTIMGFEEIKFARVHIVMAESGLFKKNKVKPKASVTLILKPDAVLRPEQVVGIQRLVAASVPEIEPAAVTVLDQQGVALSRNPQGEPDPSGLNLQMDLSDSLSQRLEIKKQAETQMKQKLAEVLDKALGPNQAIVSVDISLNYDHVKITKEDVLGANNDNGEVAGVVVRKRDSMRGQTVPAGDPGIQRSEGTRNSVVPSESSTSEVDYQTGRRIEQVISTPGSIRRISVGILVPNYQTEERLQKIKEVIQMAAGISADRGDALAIYSLDQVLVRSPDANAAPPSDTMNGDAGHSGSRPGTQPVATYLPAYIRVLAYVLGAISVIAIGVAVYRRRAGRGTPKAATMTPIEREQLLREVRSWLEPMPGAESKGVSP